MDIQQSLEFRKAYKKLHERTKAVVNDEIRKIIDNPEIGEEKKQDLRGVYVHKFKIDDRLYLLSYAFDPKTLTLLMLGVHENFYRDLKRRL